MGKRKSKTKIIKRVRESVPTKFDCMFCNHAHSVECHMSFTTMLGTVRCRVCGAMYQTTITHLSDPIDIYSEWVDETEKVNQQGYKQHHHDAEDDDIDDGAADDNADIDVDDDIDIDIDQNNQKKNQKNLKNELKNSNANVNVIASETKASAKKKYHTHQIDMDDKYHNHSDHDDHHNEHNEDQNKRQKRQKQEQNSDHDREDQDQHQDLDQHENMP